MKARAIVCVALFAVAVSVSVQALDWPVEKRIVTGTFGEDRGDHFHAGLDIGGGSQAVHPVMPGELVFRYDEGSSFTSIPRGTGSFVVLQHGQGILTLYCHLAEGSLGVVHTAYTPADQVGIIGETGHADGRHLHFSVFDREEGAAINPLTLLPAVPDSQPPVIRRILLSSGNTRQELETGASVAPGTWDVFAEVYDLREDVHFHSPLAPYGVSLSVDGKETSRILFDLLQVKEGKAVLGASALTRAALYDADRLVRCGNIELRAGASRLRMVARDFAGNETVKEIAFTVHD
jgi:hypothetical protein